LKGREAAISPIHSKQNESGIAICHLFAGNEGRSTAFKCSQSPLHDFDAITPSMTVVYPRPSHATVCCAYYFLKAGAIWCPCSWDFNLSSGTIQGWCTSSRPDSMRWKSGSVHVLSLEHHTYRNHIYKCSNWLSFVLKCFCWVWCL